MSEGTETGSVERIFAYHEATKHSPESVGRSRWAMDWSNRPDPFKRYVGLDEVRLERPSDGSERPALDAIADVSRDAPDAAVDRDTLARVLTWGAGVHHAVRHPDGDVFHFRTYASAGALYPVEAYVACGDLEGLAAGVYHYRPLGDALVPIRRGDHRAALVHATAEEPAVARASAVVVLTGIPWRTAWKYAERGYRHLFWDAGMVVANVLAIAASLGVAARVVLGFADREVEVLLGLDGARESPLALLALGASEGTVAPSSAPAEEVELRRRALSRVEYSFEAITAANEATRLGSPDDVLPWRDRALADRPRPRTDRALDPPAVDDPVEEVIRRRGSARRFGTEPMPRDVLLDVLRRSTRGIPTDHAPDGSHLIEPYVVVNDVDGLEPGAYVWRDGELRLLRAGDLRREAAFLCLDQPLGGRSAATMFLTTDLASTLERLGARGYRAAQLEGGVVAGKVYLATYAHRFGATGLTFYDDEVERFFSPDAAGRSCMLVVAVGDRPRVRGSA